METLEKIKSNTELFAQLYNNVVADVDNIQVDKRILESYNKIKTQSIPDIKHEDWKYSNFKSKLLSFKFQKEVKEIPIFETHISNQNKIVIKGGNILSIELTKQTFGKVEILPLIEGIGKYPEIIEKYFYKTTHHHNDYFTHLNQAFSLNGIFIFVHDDNIIDEPIYLESDLYEEETSIHQTHNLVLVGRNSSFHLIKMQSCSDNGAEVFHNLLTDVVLLDNSKFSFNRLQNECTNSYQVTNFYASLLPHAELNLTNLCIGGAFTRNNFFVELNGVQSNAKITGLNILDDTQHVDNWVKMHHHAPHCESDQLFKSIVDDTATSVFSGRIYVAKHAQKTNAYQSNKNIVLTDNANVYSKPQLEIYADDVKCSHGSTSGQINDDELFYLRARGIKESEARKLLLYAFAENILERIDDEFFRTEAQKVIDLKFEK